MKSYCIRDASEMMFDDVFCVKGCNKQKMLINILKRNGVIRKGSITDNYYKQGKWILDENFEHYSDIQEYFDECYVTGGWYQLKITEKGIDDLLEYIYLIEEEGDYYE